MDTQHTPGPWGLFFNEDTRDLQIENAKGEPIVYIVGAEQNVLANARLIAAAPDLLEALEALDKALPNFIFDPVLAEFVSVWGDKVVPAIKKAKGA
jgi:hypothetical protein